MAGILTDQLIDQLIKEGKPLPADYMAKIQVKPKRGHKERELDIRGVSNSNFRLILRENMFNSLDFSVILAYCPSNSNAIFRLRRYNGKSHEHTNPIEQNKFYDFHIHHATERYQQLGAAEDTFAEPTDRYSDLHEAVLCMIKDCGFELPFNPQLPLFEGA
jgi:hypothetical protein